MFYSKIKSKTRNKKMFLKFRLITSINFATKLRNRFFKLSISKIKSSKKICGDVLNRF